MMGMGLKLRVIGYPNYLYTSSPPFPMNKNKSETEKLDFEVINMSVYSNQQCEQRDNWE